MRWTKRRQQEALRVMYESAAILVGRGGTWIAYADAFAESARFYTRNESEWKKRLKVIGLSDAMVTRLLKRVDVLARGRAGRCMAPRLTLRLWWRH